MHKVGRLRFAQTRVSLYYWLLHMPNLPSLFRMVFLLKTDPMIVGGQSGQVGCVSVSEMHNPRLLSGSPSVSYVRSLS